MSGIIRMWRVCNRLIGNRANKRSTKCYCIWYYRNSRQNESMLSWLMEIEQCVVQVIHQLCCNWDLAANLLFDGLEMDWSEWKSAINIPKVWLQLLWCIVFERSWNTKKLCIGNIKANEGDLIRAIHGREFNGVENCASRYSPVVQLWND